MELRQLIEEKLNLLLEHALKFSNHPSPIQLAWFVRLLLAMLPVRLQPSAYNEQTKVFSNSTPLRTEAGAGQSGNVSCITIKHYQCRGARAVPNVPGQSQAITSTCCQSSPDSRLFPALRTDVHLVLLNQRLDFLVSFAFHLCGLSLPISDLALLAPFGISYNNCGLRLLHGIRSLGNKPISHSHPVRLVHENELAKLRCCHVVQIRR